MAEANRFLEQEYWPKRPGGLRISCAQSLARGVHPSNPSSTKKPRGQPGIAQRFPLPTGLLPIAPEPAPSLRLWASAPGATPVRLIKHTTGGPNHRSKPELSTLPETGSFYFALTGGLSPTEWHGAGCRVGRKPPCPRPRPASMKVPASLERVLCRERRAPGARERAVPLGDPSPEVIFEGADSGNAPPGLRRISATAAVGGPEFTADGWPRGRSPRPRTAAGA